MNVRVLVLALAVLVLAILMVSLDPFVTDVAVPDSSHSFHGQVRHVPSTGNTAGSARTMQLLISEAPDGEGWVEALLSDAALSPDTALSPDALVDTQGTLLASTFDLSTLLDPDLSSADLNGASILITPFGSQLGSFVIELGSFDHNLNLSRTPTESFVGFGRISAPGSGGGSGSGGVPQTNGGSSDPLTFVLSSPAGDSIGDGTIEFSADDDFDDPPGEDSTLVAFILKEDFEGSDCLADSPAPLTDCEDVLTVLFDASGDDINSLSSNTVPAPPALALFGVGLLLLRLFSYRRR